VVRVGERARRWISHAAAAAAGPAASVNLPFDMHATTNPATHNPLPTTNHQPQATHLGLQRRRPQPLDQVPPRLPLHVVPARLHRGQQDVGGRLPGRRRAAGRVAVDQPFHLERARLIDRLHQALFGGAGIRGVGGLGRAATGASRGVIRGATAAGWLAG